MKQAVRAIVIRDSQLLVMHRNKFGQEYYTLVGGGVELNESLDEALVRELSEETSLQVANSRLVYIEEADPMYGTQYVYLCDYAGGEIMMSPASEEAKINQLGQNLYTPMWLPLDQLPAAEFVSPGLKNRIMAALQSGWPETPQQFQHTQVTP